MEKANFWIVIYTAFDYRVEINDLITGSADFVTIRQELVVLLLLPWDGKRSIAFIPLIENALIITTEV